MTPKKQTKTLENLKNRLYLRCNRRRIGTGPGRTTFPLTFYLYKGLG